MFMTRTNLKKLCVASLKTCFNRHSKSFNATKTNTFLPPANEVFKGYVFTRVCLSTGGVCLSACWYSRPPPGADPSPLGADPPKVDTPPGADPPAQCMLGYTANKRAVRILLECNLLRKYFHDTCRLKNHSNTLTEEHTILTFSQDGCL